MEALRVLLYGLVAVTIAVMGICGICVVMLFNQKAFYSREFASDQSEQSDQPSKQKRPEMVAAVQIALPEEQKQMI